MSKTSHDTAALLASLAAIIGGALLNQAAHGALQVYVPLQMVAAGTAPVWIGVVTSAFAAGFLAGCFLASKLLGRLGHVRAFAWCAASQGLLTLALLLTERPEAWLALRFAMGVAGACIAVTYESWINDRTPLAMRGRIFGLYNVLNRLSQLAGQLACALLAAALLAAAGASALFVVLGAVFALSLVPVGLTRSASPLPPAIRRPPMRALWRKAPVAVATAFHSGMAGTVLISILPVYAQSQGMAVRAAALLAVAAQAGCLMTQWPLGEACDRRDSARVIGAAASVACIAAVALYALSQAGATTWALPAIAAVMGGAILPTYALSFTHASQQESPGTSTVGLSSGLLTSWSAGSIAGPVLATFAMQHWGPAALALYLAFAAMLLAMFACRHRRQPGTTRQGK
ncbi:MAG: MFS transporter [Comamonadaceae bacterium]|nr:MAG: MFS transporter [Comamonadaceae bacterium]